VPTIRVSAGGRDYRLGAVLYRRIDVYPLLYYLGEYTNIFTKTTIESCTNKIQIVDVV